MQSSQIDLPASFPDALSAHGLRLQRDSLEILQLNLGKLCNLTCSHCHVNAGPARKEIMQSQTVDKFLEWYRQHPIPVVDLTGGAPEMMPDFRRLVDSLLEINPAARIIDRCNLVILNEPGYEWLSDFMKERELEIVASMPCYTAENVNEQRGDGVFDRSIKALQELNEIGYGTGDAKRPLNLVYNPGGAWLPPEQDKLEADYKRELLEHFGIRFDKLYALANLPVSRFASYLRGRGEYQEYMQLLVSSFNPATVEGLMCRNTLSVDWTGRVYDCDFNQMLKLSWIDDDKQSLYLWELDPDELPGREVQVASHCFGCTAGSGSSCGGSLS